LDFDDSKGRPVQTGKTKPATWQLTKDSLHAECRVFDIRKKHFRHPTNGAEGDFFVLDSRDWVNVVAPTTDGAIVMVRQFRFGLNDVSWEVPGGIIEKGEDPVVAGLRELEEETGYRAKSGRIIGHCSPNPAIINNRCHVVLAEGVEPVGNFDWDEHEEIEVRAVPENEVFAWVRTMQIRHSLALNALMFYRLSKTGVGLVGSLCGLPQLVKPELMALSKPLY